MSKSGKINTFFLRLSALVNCPRNDPWQNSEDFHFNKVKNTLFLHIFRHYFHGISVLSKAYFIKKSAFFVNIFNKISISRTKWLSKKFIYACKIQKCKCIIYHKWRLVSVVGFDAKKTMIFSIFSKGYPFCFYWKIAIFSKTCNYENQFWKFHSVQILHV